MRSEKNRRLVNQLEEKIDNMCGIGTRLTKLFLNKKVKEGDDIAFLYRQLLECEMLNINAKRYRNTSSFNYKDMYYDDKKKAIDSLIEALLECNPLKITYGFEFSDVIDTKHIIYFDVPNCGQISFHTDISERLLPYVDAYKAGWDGLINSSLIKIEYGILTTYKNELIEKYGEAVERKYISIQKQIEMAKEQEKNRREKERIINEQLPIVKAALEKGFDEFFAVTKDNHPEFKKVGELIPKELWKNISKELINKISKENNITLDEINEDTLDNIKLIKKEIKENEKYNYFKRRIDIGILDPIKEKAKELFINGTIKLTHKTELVRYLEERIMQQPKFLQRISNQQIQYLIQWHEESPEKWLNVFNYLRNKMRKKGHESEIPERLKQLFTATTQKELP